MELDIRRRGEKSFLSAHLLRSEMEEEGGKKRGMARRENRYMGFPPLYIVGNRELPFLESVNIHGMRKKGRHVS